MDKKIDIPVLRQRIFWTVTMCSIALLMVLSIQRKLNDKVSNVVVNIEPLKGKRNLISSKEIKNTFTRFLGEDVDHVDVQMLDINELEQLLKADKRVKEVNLYIDGKRKLNIDIKQKRPLVRIMDGSSRSYYLDENGKQIPVVQGAAIRVPVATGHFELYEEKAFNSDKPYKLRQVYNLAKKIMADPFMEVLVEQIDVNEKGELVVIPKIGRQQIVLGDDQDLDSKFENLKVMYKEGLPREGWRKYHTLLLNFKGQVIGVEDEVNEPLPVIIPTPSLVDASLSKIANEVKPQVKEKKVVAKPVVKKQEAKKIVKKKEVAKSTAKPSKYKKTNKPNK